MGRSLKATPGGPTTNRNVSFCQHGRIQNPLMQRLDPVAGVADTPYPLRTRCRRAWGGSAGCKLGFLRLVQPIGGQQAPEFTLPQFHPSETRKRDSSAASAGVHPGVFKSG
jgi:hypothetical protein